LAGIASLRRPAHSRLIVPEIGFVVKGKVRIDKSEFRAFLPFNFLREYDIILFMVLTSFLSRWLDCLRIERYSNEM
jgi:hypothetical protein